MEKSRQDLAKEQHAQRPVIIGPSFDALGRQMTGYGAGRGGPRLFSTPIPKTDEQFHRRDVIADRIKSGKPLPLDIILKTMDFFDEKATEAIAEYKNEQSEYNRQIMLDYLERVEKSALQAAKYFHPQLANVQLSGENGGPIKVAHAHVLMNDLRGKSDDDLARSYAELLMGHTAEPTR